jgi:hypothetical protein
MSSFHGIPFVLACAPSIVVVSSEYLVGATYSSSLETENDKDGKVDIRLFMISGCGLAQERNRWRALVNSVLNLRVP